MVGLGYLNVIYDESNQDSYERIEATFGEEYKEFNKKFETGKFEIDYISCVKYAIDLRIKNYCMSCWSSSLNHFLMDGDNFKVVFLVYNKKKNIFKFQKSPEVKNGDSYMYEVFLPTSMKDMTYEEFNKYYKENK